MGPEGNAGASIALPAGFGPRAIPEWFRTWSGVADQADLAISPALSSSLEPAGISVLAAGIAARARGGMRTSIRALEGLDSLGYLQRIGFFDQLGVQLPESFRHHPAEGRFVPLRRIVDEATAKSVADETAEVLRAQFPGLPSSVLRGAHFVLEELGVNIVQHSQAPETGFGLAQAYPTERRLQIAFADAGVGFLASLRRNPELTGRVEDEGEAIQLALKEGVSFSGSEANLGIGLGFLRSFADLLGGDLWIASGGALLHRRTISGQRATTVRPISPWHGAWVCLDAPLPGKG